MAYVKAKILLCATCMTERRPVLASPYFLDSLEAGYKTDPTTIVNTLHSDYRLELEVVLSQYFDKVLGCKGAGGLAKPLPLKYCRSTKPPLRLSLRQAVEMAAAMATFVPSDSHPPPGRQRVVPVRVPGRRSTPRGRGGELARTRPRRLQRRAAAERDNKSDCTCRTC